VNLSWEKPESDGGARIQGYWVDKREVSSFQCSCVKRSEVNNIILKTYG